MHALLEGSIFSSVYRLEISRLPVRHVDRRFRLLGFGLLLFGLIFAVIALVSLLTREGGGGPDADPWGDALFLAVAVVMLVVVSLATMPPLLPLDLSTVRAQDTACKY